MSPTLFIALATMALLALLLWGIRLLAAPRWQVLAVLPVSQVRGRWRGVNLTWYGFFIAWAAILGLTLSLVLLGALDVPPVPVLLTGGLLLAVCTPAARIVARLVEGKQHTLTVGGAIFVGLLCAPGVILLSNALAPKLGLSPLPLLPTLAALSCGVALGEGIGRLGCISFGCCYGKPLSRYPAPIARLLTPLAYVCHGPTRKAAYAGHCEGQPLFPIQACSSLVLTLIAMSAALLLLENHPRLALLLALGGSLLWRVLSEQFRADFRGHFTFSAYQRMAMAGLLLTLLLAWLLPTPPLPSADPAHGLSLLWDPLVLLALQLTWLALFVRTGRSTVTTAEVTLQVVRENI